jgi:hypothetical protein
MFSNIRKIIREVNLRQELLQKDTHKKFGVDYFNTYAPVSGLDVIRLFFAIAAFNRFKTFHVDVDSAFLYASLKDIIFMEFPEGIELLNGKYSKVNRGTHCVQLLRSLYGLKQSPLEWFNLLVEFIESIGFCLNAIHKCLSTKYKSQILIYVDDILITGPESTTVRSTIKNRFSIKDLGLVKEYLGISANFINNGYSLSQFFILIQS